MYCTLGHSVLGGEDMPADACKCCSATRYEVIAGPDWLGGWQIYRRCTQTAEEVTYDRFDQGSR